MKPPQCWWHLLWTIRRQRRELLCVPLLNHPEAAELALPAVKVTVVVSVASDEVIPADAVIDFDALDYVDWERNSGNPGTASALSAR